MMTQIQISGYVINELLSNIKEKKSKVRLGPKTLCMREMGSLRLPLQALFDLSVAADQIHCHAKL